MTKKITKEELNELQNQLSNPSGEKGKEVAKKMHESNFSMTKATIDCLNIQPKNTILELGHGNCEHLPYILNKEKELIYSGLEISKTMQLLSQNTFTDFVTLRVANFDLYDGKNIPYAKNSFDRIFTVNTIYFWENPKIFLMQIAKILKPNGKFVITFADRNFMKTLPFVQQKFTLYNETIIKQLIEKTPFSIHKITKNTEKVVSKSNENVIRKYLIVELIKTNG